MEITCGQTTEARPHPVEGNGDHRMGDAQGSRGGWINSRERDREVVDPSPERVRGWHRVGCARAVVALVRRALSVRCVACTTFAAGFVVMFVWG